MKHAKKKELDWFLTMLQSQFAFTTQSGDIGVEATEPEVEEVVFVYSSIFSKWP